jgi:hypothetical protein
MKSARSWVFTLISGLLVAASAAFADGISKETQAKIDAKVKEIQAWAGDPVLLKAVLAHNAGLPPDAAGLDQDKWKALTVLDPLVRSFTKNEAGQFLKGKKDEAISEAFVSGADGTKVAFLSKPTNWCHKGKPKHDQPMGGKTWQGSVEVDESTGQQQIQVAVPILDKDKPVGSLVVGLSLSKLDGN